MKDEPFFHPVEDGVLSTFHTPAFTYRFRMDPLFSPNTGEFLVILAAPRTAVPPGHLERPDLKLKVLAVRLESLFNPVLPTGYGFVVVNPEGKVLFHSASVRNLNEDFIKETVGNVSLSAALAQGNTTDLDLRYMGTDKEMWITPIRSLSDPRLMLVVFKDSSYFTTVNTMIVIIFSLLVVTYAILPAFAVALIYVFRRRAYPLEIIWPNCNRMSHYLHLFAAYSLLSAAFLCRYVCFGMQRSLITVFAVALVAAIYPFLECRTRFRFLANSLVLVVLIAVSDLSLVLICPALFALYTFYPRCRQFDDSLARRFSIKSIYALSAASLLVVLVVVPACGFFKVSYDYVQRLFIQVQQLDLAERLDQRDKSVEARYLHLNAPPGFAQERRDVTWDRYDELFLNCGDTTDLPDRGLKSNFVERGILFLISRVPVNSLASRLQELARDEALQQEKTWRVSDRTAGCQPNGLARGTLWLDWRSGKPIVSLNPVWPALDLRVGLLLCAAILALGVWIHFVLGRLFLLDMESLPLPDLWEPGEGIRAQQIGDNILLIGHPKSGKRLTVERLGCAQILDFAGMAITNKWELPDICDEVVALNHFEFQVDDARANKKKLGILEDLIHVRHKRVILLSTVDPLYYLTAGCPDILVTGEKKDMATAIQLLDRWAALLTRFHKVRIKDITERRFQKKGIKSVLEKASDEHREFARRVVEECDHTAQLRKIGSKILSAHLVADAKGERRAKISTRDGLIQELLDRADSYYRTLWSTCTPDERLVLFQLASDGWANPRNQLAIQHLERRNLVTRPNPKIDVRSTAPCDADTLGRDHAPPVGLRIMNESFREFIRKSQHREEIAAWEQEGEQSVWRFLKLSLVILTAAVAAWLLYSQQQFFNTVVAYVGALGAAVGVVFKLLGDLRGRGSTPNAGGR